MNIVFILCDDLGWMDLQSYGSSFYETPNLDKLAARGMRFTNSYASCPVCSPTRASALTGKYPATVGITQYLDGHKVVKLCDVPYFYRLPKNEYTLPAALKDAKNYQTWHVGKWHLGNAYPDTRGFERNIGGCEMGGPHKHGYFAPWGIPTLEDGPDGEYLTDRLNDEAIKLIQERDKDRPFFLNYWPYAVHTPLQAPQELIEKYEKKAEAMGLDKEDPIEPGENKWINRRKFQSHPVYAAMIENLDTNMGKLVDAIEEQGLTEETLIVFTSDNGGLATAEGSPTCNAPLAEGKGWMYEGGTREPLIAVLPGVIEAGSVCDSVTTTPDFYPTFLDLAGIEPLPKQHVDGVSIAPLLKGEKSFDRGPVFWHYPHYSNQGGAPGCSMRDGDWKLIEFFEDGDLELYNLKNDISETQNLADQEPERVKDMHQKLIQWRESVYALIPRPNPNYPELVGR